MATRVNVFFGRDGKPLHTVWAKPDKKGRLRTMCGKLCPSFFRLSPRHACKVEGLSLACPACEQELYTLKAKLEEEERSIYEPTEPAVIPPARQGAKGVVSDAPKAPGSQGQA